MDRNNNFTIIHILAACMVIAGHQFVLMNLTPPLILGQDIHGLGVRILFLVSGFLVSASYMRTNTIGKYLWKRFSRLYPPLFLCLIITVLIMRIITVFPQHYWLSSLKYIAYNLELRPKFDLAGVFQDNPYKNAINGSLWTLPIEVICYLLLIPIIEIYKFLHKFHGVLSLAFMLLLLLMFTTLDYIRIKYLNESMLIFWDTDWYNFVSLEIWFLVGVFFQVFSLKKICNWQIGIPLILIFSCLPPTIKYISTPFIVGYLLFCFAFAHNPLYVKINRDICYELYLYAFPIQQILIYLFIIELNFNCSAYILLVLSIISTFIVAVVAHFLVEKILCVIRINNNTI